jgi:hypothetical protein
MPGKEKCNKYTDSERLLWMIAYFKLECANQYKCNKSGQSMLVSISLLVTKQ